MTYYKFKKLISILLVTATALGGHSITLAANNKTANDDSDYDIYEDDYDDYDGYDDYDYYSEEDFSSENSEEIKDKKVSKEDDYYEAINAPVLNMHRNGDSIENWTWFDELIQKAYNEQESIIKESAKNIDKNTDTSSIEYKLGTLYQQAMDSESRKKDSIEYFNKLMEPAMKAKTVQEYINSMADLQYHYGFSSPLDTEVYAPDETPDKYIVNLKDFNYALDIIEFEDEEAIVSAKDYYTSYLANILKLSGKKDSQKIALEVFDFVKDVAKNSGQDNYGYGTIDEIQNIVSNIDLKEYLSHIYKTIPQELYVRELESFKKLNEYFTEDNLPLLKNYSYLINLEKFSEYLTPEILKERITMDEEYQGNVPDEAIEKATINQISSLLPWEVGKLYTDKNFDNDKKEGIEKLVKELFDEYGNMLNDAKWLSEDTKKNAINKLNKIDIRIGLPENISEYLSEYIPLSKSQGGSYIKNAMEFKREGNEKSYDNYGNKVDRNIWNLVPQELNPCYYPTDNSINIPVAALEEPYFSTKATEETNLGAIGTVIAHEITHAFDDLGSKYDGDGNYVDWWTEKDKKEFENRAEKIVEYYNNYKTPDAPPQDGQQTLGENIADIGSMNCLSRIVKRKNLNAQKFFESYANIWASTSDGFTQAIMSGMDEHAADKVRVNAVLSSCKLFYKTYNINNKNGMYIKPENRVEFWSDNYSVNNDGKKGLSLRQSFCCVCKLEFSVANKNVTIMKMYTICDNVTTTNCRGEHCSSVAKPVRVFDKIINDNVV